MSFIAESILVFVAGLVAGGVLFSGLVFWAGEQRSVDPSVAHT